MLLENKVAVIYGAGGPIGAAVASAFAREGARVFLAGRTKAKLDRVAGAIRSQGGLAEAAVVDALEGLRRQWAVELGWQGIRLVTLKTGGIIESIRRAALLNYTATLADVGNVAAFVASDLSRSMTASVVNISCGALVD